MNPVNKPDMQTTTQSHPSMIVVFDVEPNPSHNHRGSCASQFICAAGKGNLTEGGAN